MKTIFRILLLVTFMTIPHIFAQVQVDSIDITSLFYGPFNKTTVELYFYNPTDRDSIEGTVEFEINKTAFIENFYLEVNGELKKATTLSKYQGEIIYDLITRKKIDPALLFKSGEGKYTLKVFPFLRHQVRKVVFEYYSVLESDTLSLPRWYFDLNTLARNVKGHIHLISYQGKNVKIYKLIQNSLSEIIAKNKSKIISYIYNLSFESEKQNKIYFDFKNLKYAPVYYLDSLHFYQTKELPDFIKLEQAKKYTPEISPYDVYPPDFILQLLNKIEDNEKPSVIAFGKDHYLNNFLRYLERKGKIFLKLDEKYRGGFSDNIYDDDYNWLLKNNNWYYIDTQLTLTQKVHSKKLKLLKIKCPFLNKFTEHLISLQKDLDYQINKDFLNSNLAKIVIEEDRRAIQIWEMVIENEFNSEPTYFTVIEEMPEPIGGIKAIQNSIFFPAHLLKGITGFRIYLLANINRSGHVISIETIKSANVSLFLNSLIVKISRLAVCLPKWKPGMQRGKPVFAQVSVPLVFITDSLSTTKELKFVNRDFVASISDTSKCYLIEKDFEGNIGEPIEFYSSRFFEIMIKTPDMIDVFYKAMYLSNYDGVAFKSLSAKKVNYYFIRKD